MLVMFVEPHVHIVHPPCPQDKARATRTVSGRSVAGLRFNIAFVGACLARGYPLSTPSPGGTQLQVVFITQCVTLSFSIYV